MAIVELAFVPLLCLALLGAERLDRASPRASSGVLALGAAAWLVGAQGLLFVRYPDYMAAYLYEARAWALPSYAGWSLAVLGLAWSSSKLGLASPRVAVPIALVCGVASLPLWRRLQLFGSTLEFREGVARSFSVAPNARTLLGLTLIAIVVPIAGTAALLLARGLLSAIRRT